MVFILVTEFDIILIKMTVLQTVILLDRHCEARSNLKAIGYTPLRT